MSDNRAAREGEAGWGWIVGYSSFAVFLRLLPYYQHLLPENYDLRWLWNFAAVGALGLFAGARLGSWAAYLVPLGAMLVSDVLLIRYLGAATFSWATPVLYASLTLNVAIGRLLRPTSSPAWAVPAALVTATQFFVASNLAEWALGGLYARTFVGLSECFVAALPFFRGTLVGDLVYAVLFFGLHAAAQALAQRENASQPA
jgi:hypothetical protein